MRTSVTLLSYWNNENVGEVPKINHFITPEINESHRTNWTSSMQKKKKKLLNPCKAAYVVCDISYLGLRPFPFPPQISNVSKSQQFWKYWRGLTSSGAPLKAPFPEHSQYFVWNCSTLKNLYPQDVVDIWFFSELRSVEKDGAPQRYQNNNMLAISQLTKVEVQLEQKKKRKPGTGGGGWI